MVEKKETFFTCTDIDKLLNVVKSNGASRFLDISENGIKAMIKEVGKDNVLEMEKGIALHDLSWEQKEVFIDNDDHVIFSFYVWSHNPKYKFKDIIDVPYTELLKAETPELNDCRYQTESEEWCYEFAITRLSVAECVRHVMYQYLQNKFHCFPN